MSLLMMYAGTCRNRIAAAGLREYNRLRATLTLPTAPHSTSLSKAKSLSSLCGLLQKQGSLQGPLRSGHRHASSAQSEYADENMFVALHNRSLIKVHGVDSVKLLQNLTTNDVNRLRHRETDQDPTTPPAPSAISSAILNNLGRVLFDVIIYGPADAAANEFYVECEQDARDDLVKHFKKYKLRSKVKFAVEDGLEVTAFVGKKAADLALQYSKNTNEIAVTDPRHPGLGTRALVPTVAAADVGVSLTSPDFMSNLVEGTLTDYVRCRYHVGVPEGLVEITKEEAFPLESNFDVLNGIDFDKGCYIGQELTARAKFVGVTRKRLLPVTIQPALNPETAPLSGTKIYHKGKSVGKFKRGIDGDGMALLRLSVTHIEDDAELTMEGPDGTTYQVHRQRPAWFMDMLKEMDES